jgi:cold shock CspA family protein
MIRLARRCLATVAVLGTALGAAACAPGMMIDDVFNPGRSSSVVHGEIRSIDTRSGRLQVRDDRGRSQTLRYDRQTTVVNGNRRMAVSSLQRGDRVRVRMVYDRQGRPWAERVEVRGHARNDRDRGRHATARVERLDGTVAWVDGRRGMVGVTRNNQTLTVHASSQMSRSDQNRFDRLRRGQRIRIDVMPVGRNQFQLVRFR